MNSRTAVALLAAVMFGLITFGCSSHTDLKIQSSNADFGNQTVELHRDTLLINPDGNSTK